LIKKIAQPNTAQDAKQPAPVSFYLGSVKVVNKCKEHGTELSGRLNSTLRLSLRGEPALCH